MQQTPRELEESFCINRLLLREDTNCSLLNQSVMMTKLLNLTSKKLKLPVLIIIMLVRYDMFLYSNLHHRYFMLKDEVVDDFLKRIEHYQAQYQTLDESMESDYSFMKIFNCGKKVLVHKHEGHIQSRIVYYLMNIHIVPRTIYLCRHGILLWKRIWGWKTCLDWKFCN